MRALLTAIIVLCCSAPAQGLEVLACEPEWSALVTELAGDLAEVNLALTAFQDPHRVQARPSLIAAARGADLVVCTGADLEIGWLPLLVRRAGNPAIGLGAPGYFLAADYVRKLEVPTRLDRAEGDLHPQGNPHIHLNPHNISRVARELGARLAELDPANAQTYADRLTLFMERWETAIERWELKGEALGGLRLVPNHRTFSYLANWLDLNMITTVEAKPGVPPSGAHLSGLLEKLAANPPAAIVRTPYGNEKQTHWVAQRLGVPELVLPYTVGGNDQATDLFGLFDSTLALLEALQR